MRERAAGLAGAERGVDPGLVEEVAAERREVGGEGAVGGEDAVTRLNAALGPDDAIPLEEFARVVALGSRAGALRVARRLETVVVGVYLNGVGYSADPGTRLLLGRLLAYANGQLALLTRLAGEQPGGLPKPIDLEAAGVLLDTYLEDPTS